MTKSFPLAVLFALVACGLPSSPEGRPIIRNEKLQAQINLLKQQNKVILDSMMLINNE